METVRFTHLPRSWRWPVRFSFKGHTHRRVVSPTLILHKALVIHHFQIEKPGSIIQVEHRANQEEWGRAIGWELKIKKTIFSRLTSYGSRTLEVFSICFAFVLEKQEDRCSVRAFRGKRLVASLGRNSSDTDVNMKLPGLLSRGSFGGRGEPILPEQCQGWPQHALSEQPRAPFFCLLAAMGIKFSWSFLAAMALMTVPVASSELVLEELVAKWALKNQTEHMFGCSSWKEGR